MLVVDTTKYNFGMRRLGSIRRHVRPIVLVSWSVGRIANRLTRVFEIVIRLVQVQTEDRMPELCFKIVNDGRKLGASGVRKYQAQETFFSLTDLHFVERSHRRKNLIRNLQIVSEVQNVSRVFT